MDFAPKHIFTVAKNEEEKHDETTNNENGLRIKTQFTTQKRKNDKNDRMAKLHTTRTDFAPLELPN